MIKSAATSALGLPTSECLGTESGSVDQRSRNERSRIIQLIPEQKLAVEVGNVDGVHVDDMNVAKPRKCQILEQFAAETTSTNDKDLALVEVFLPLREKKDAR